MNNDDQNGKAHREEVCPGKKGKLDLVQVRADIEKKNGPEFWRSLEELAGSAEFREMMHREFPKGASEWIDAVSRRGFLKLMGSSLALAGMTACTKQPFEPIVPYASNLTSQLPKRFEWSYQLAVPSKDVPLTDSLVLVFRTTDGRIAARVAARL